MAHLPISDRRSASCARTAAWFLFAEAPLRHTAASPDCSLRSATQISASPSRFRSDRLQTTGISAGRLSATRVSPADFGEAKREQQEAPPFFSVAPLPLNPLSFAFYLPGTSTSSPSSPHQQAQRASWWGVIAAKKQRHRTRATRISCTETGPERGHFGEGAPTASENKGACGGHYSKTHAPQQSKNQKAMAFDWLHRQSELMPLLDTDSSIAAPREGVSSKQEVFR